MTAQEIIREAARRNICLEPEGERLVCHFNGTEIPPDFERIVDHAPADVVARCRYWDRAASEQRPGTDPDASAGVLLSKTADGIYFVEDCRKLFASPHVVQQTMLNCAMQDATGTIIGFMQDPGSAGVMEAQATARALDGFDVRFATATGSKEVRAKPTSAQCEAGNFKIVRGSWNDDFIRELENFPAGRHDDAVDGLSGAHAMLAQFSGAIATVIRRGYSDREFQLSRM